MSSIDLESEILKLREDVLHLMEENRKLRDRLNHREAWEHCPEWMQDRCNDYEHCEICLIGRIFNPKTGGVPRE